MTEKGNIMEQYESDNTKIIICDDYCVVSENEKAKVIAALHEAGWSIIDELVDKGEDI
ncbi:hypothetical protein [Longirhabdus pacifica]|uniref:hypothetical protein n=1 Tax=Longirhabdus pacifica TaxID=2305227 RepID=UPI0013E8CCDF|nr:hypothetical protein [Longirhabdus pacifica]